MTVSYSEFLIKVWSRDRIKNTSLLMLLGKKISFYAIETIHFYYYFLNFLLNTIFINSLVVGPGLKVCEEQSTLSRDDLMN